MLMKYINRRNLFLLSAILMFFAVLSCSINRQKNDLLVYVGVLTNVNMPDQSTGSFFRLDNDTTLICNLNNMVLYRQSVEYTDYNEKALNNGRFEITDDSTTIRSRTRLHRFYIHYKNEKFGLMYESSDKNTKGIPFKVDSLLIENPVFKGGTTELDDKISLFSKTETSDGLILEKYIYKIRPKPNYPDTSCLFYNKNWKNNVKYSLSKSLDSTTKMTLVRVNFIFNPIAKQENTSSGKFTSKLFDVRMFNPNLKQKELYEVKEAFQKYEKDQK